MCNMRVGALPKFPLQRAWYNLTWSTDGLINEYNPCEGDRQRRTSRRCQRSRSSSISLDGDDYEAFNTSGGLWHPQSATPPRAGS